MTFLPLQIPSKSTGLIKRRRLALASAGALSALLLTITPAKAGILDILDQFGISIDGVANVLGLGDELNQFFELANTVQDWSEAIGNFSFDQIMNVVTDQLGGLLSGDQVRGATGSMGIPDPGEILTSVLNPRGDGEASKSPVTPGVNPAVPAEIFSNRIITERLTAPVFSEEGQQSTRKMLEQVGQTVQTTGDIATNSQDSLVQQQDAANAIAQAVQDQVSTQDVLKTGFSGQAALSVAQSSLTVALSQQNAAMSQLQTAQIALAQQTRDGIAGANLNLSQVNSQLNQGLEREMANRNAELQSSRTSYRVNMRAMR